MKPHQIALATSVATLCFLVERPSAAQSEGSPLTLMQWSYGDGADSDNVFGPIETDRPYFTKTASVVERSNWQLETGYAYSHIDHYGRRQTLHSFPDGLLRVGLLAEWLELRLGWTWFEHQTNRYYIRDKSGASDPNVGIKIALTPQDEMLPQTAIVINTDLPSSMWQVAPDFVKMQAGFDVVYRWELAGGYSMGGQTGFQRALYDYYYYRVPYILLSQSWIVQREFTDYLSGFAEWFVLSPDTEVGTPAQHYLDGGLLFLVTDKVQLDAAVGCGLTDRATDNFVRTGVSILW